jgi:hypothetical protein
MHVLSTIIPSLGLFAYLSAAAYTLRDDYGTTDSFFDKFNFYTVCLIIVVLIRSVSPILTRQSDRARILLTAT